MQANRIVNKVLKNHFSTAIKNVELRLYENGVYQTSSFHHTGHLAWGAGENWKMLGNNKTYIIVQANLSPALHKRFCWLLYG